MYTLDAFAGLIVIVQAILYARILPYFITFVIGVQFKPELVKPIVVIIFIFNLLMIVSSAARVYSGFRLDDEKEKKYNYAMALAGTIVVMFINVIGEMLTSSFGLFK